MAAHAEIQKIYIKDGSEASATGEKTDAPPQAGVMRFTVGTLLPTLMFLLDVVAFERRRSALRYILVRVRVQVRRIHLRAKIFTHRGAKKNY